MLGVSHAAVSQWENGRSQPSKAMALRLADVISGLHRGRVAAEIAFTAPLQQIKVLVRGENFQLVGLSSGFKAAWPEMIDFFRQELRPFLINEAQLYVEGDYIKEAERGDLLMLSGVSNRLLAVGAVVSERFRFRWHVIIRRIDGELIHEVVFEPCDDGAPMGFERVLRRDEISSLYD